LIKLYPAMLLPVLLRPLRWQMPVAFAGLVALGYLFYLDAGTQILGYLPVYMTAYEAYNLGLRAVLTAALGFFGVDAFRWSQWLASTILLSVMVWCVKSGQRSAAATVHWGVGVIALYFLLVSPSVFQWYLVWLLAFVALGQTWSVPAWLYWSWSVNLDYLQTLPVFEGSVFWLRLAEYAPIFFWLGGGWLWFWSRQDWQGKAVGPRAKPRGACH
jgi:hypothetical protein